VIEDGRGARLTSSAGTGRTGRLGAIARHELAAAVSDAGGLGTIAGARAPIAAELAAARRLTDRPVAINLLLPFLRPGDVEEAAAADAIVTFWGEPRRLAAASPPRQPSSRSCSVSAGPARRIA